MFLIAYKITFNYNFLYSCKQFLFTNIFTDLDKLSKKFSNLFGSVTSKEKKFFFNVSTSIKHTDHIGFFISF